MELVCKIFSYKFTDNCVKLDKKNPLENIFPAILAQAGMEHGTIIKEEKLYPNPNDW